MPYCKTRQRAHDTILCSHAALTLLKASIRYNDVDQSQDHGQSFSEVEEIQLPEVRAMSDSDNNIYPGNEANVTWNGKLCIHIGECGRAKGDLFIGGRKPWCQPDSSSREEIEEVVLRCPTGALTFEFADGSVTEQTDAENTVTVSYNGPLFCRGDLAIEDAPDAAPGLKFRAALCRCGQSKNKPFCDNSHEEAGFRDFGAIGETGPGFSGQGGELAITPAKDGPLIVSGKVTLQSGSGRKAWRGEQAFLCRCGASKNKPFCDGSHKKVGFTSD
jgi:CDGSH-type Zn-finger protein/uncharacterized Fe-S cluster protein YjdI